MRAGKLDREIVIERNTPTRDSYGASIEGWATLATVWARKLEESGKEFFSADQVVADQKVVWRIRWPDGFTPTVEDRINYDGNYYDITALPELGRRAGMDIHSVAQVT